jgi:hypothetical protein
MHRIATAPVAPIPAWTRWAVAVSIAARYAFSRDREPVTTGCSRAPATTSIIASNRSGPVVRILTTTAVPEVANTLAAEPS